MNKLLMMDELSETCKVSCQNKFVKLVHLVGFITKKNVTEVGASPVGVVAFALSLDSCSKVGGRL